MMPRRPSLLLEILRRPDACATLPLGQWDLLVCQARRAELLAHLHALFEARQLLSQVPAQALLHLESARIYARAQQRVVRWEVRCLARALQQLEIPLLLLKGAAYLLAELPNSRGRLFNDIDILVPKVRLDAVEQALLQHGWMSTHLDAYDQRYYRTWMHELPPLRHIRRRTVLDVHHNILPETARLHPDPGRLLAAAVTIDEQRGLQVLAPADMVLHSATHLFHDGELERGLRDLVDLDTLLRHFSSEEGFWTRLQMRARELDLQRPLYYALRYTARLLDTPVPQQALDFTADGRPPTPLSAVMDALFRRALEVDHDSCKPPGSGLARGLLYIRSHYLRMPLHLLIPHLLRKAFRQSAGE
ncbi:MAG: nucleotidyltransferase family protein [Gammaproteobacteria bacterium]